MSAVKVTVKGADKVVKNLEKIVSKMTRNLIEAVEITQAKIVNDAKMLVPVKTGFLQSSIQPGSVDVNARRAYVSGTVLADAEYASFVEFGTRRQKAQPFMVPSILKNRAEFQRRVKAATQE